MGSWWQNRTVARCSEEVTLPGRVLYLVDDPGAEIVSPSCGACINAGPGVSRSRDEVTIASINRNFPGRSGPGNVYLASPSTVVASALAGHIATWSSLRRRTEDA